MDIVIVYHSKDSKILPYCVEGTKHINNRRNVYLVTNKDPCIENTIFIDETLFPFSKSEIESYLYENHKSRAGWYYQQLLKMYSYKIIDSISDNFLILDSDTVFLNEVSFINENKICYSTSSENNIMYYEHMNIVLPGLEKQIPTKSGIVHHMVFNKEILNEIVTKIENIHQTTFWDAMMKNINKEHGNESTLSEYEIYFNYVNKYHSDKIVIRELIWRNISDLPNWNTYTKIKDLLEYAKNFLHYVSIHLYLVEGIDLS
jgi:hypothetical protein